MSLRDEIEARFMQAMKAKDAAATSTLRLLRSALKNEEIAKMTKALSDEQVIDVIGREAKKLKDSLADFEKGARTDLAASTRAELDLLSAFLPAQLSEDEVRAAVKAKASELGLSGQAAYGRLMGEMMKELKGKADGGLVGRIVKESLES